MPIDDKVEKALESLSREGQVSVGGEVLLATIAGIPIAGSSITSLVQGRHQRFVQERAVDVFKAMKEQLTKLDEKKVDKDFFETDEFQVLLALALEQVQTTNDKSKIQMLGCGLANSGSLEFSSENRKELLLRILRELSPSHIQTLQRLLPTSKLKVQAGSTFWPVIAYPNGEELAILERLAANGLVEDFFDQNKSFPGPRFGNEWTEADVKRALKEYVRKVLERHFRITRFGIDFLSYFGQRVQEDR